MLIFAIDDEPAMLEELREAIAIAKPDAEICAFFKAREALSMITEKGMKPDVVFSDIEMPGMTGLSLAVKIKKEVPTARIVFVTGYSQYAIEAYRRHVNGYVLKPVDADMIREELDQFPAEPRPEEGRLYIRCFGDFEVFWDRTPLLFERRQTKELFAFLIDKRGASCTPEELAAALWEDESDMKALKTRIRSLIHDLKNTFTGIGMEEILIRRRGLIALKTDRIECDYYRMLGGDMEAVNSFHGEYMKQYSWAEITRGELYFKWR